MAGCFVASNFIVFNNARFYPDGSLFFRHRNNDFIFPEPFIYPLDTIDTLIVTLSVGKVFLRLRSLTHSLVLPLDWIDKPRNYCYSFFVIFIAFIVHFLTAVDVFMMQNIFLYIARFSLKRFFFS